MLSYFTSACQRISLGDFLKIGRTLTYNPVRSTGNVANWDADKYSKVVSVVLENAAPLLDVLKAQPGERILDLGCGSGELTMALKDVGAEVVAVDVSPSMVEAAKAKGDGNSVFHGQIVLGLDARVCDGHELDFKEEFDVVFSNMALQWMKKDPRQVVKNIHNALKKNGRFVAQLNGTGSWDPFLKHGMTVFKRHGLPITNPMYTPSEEEYADLLKSEGFDIEHMSLLPRDILVPGGPRTIFDLFVSRYLGDVDDSKKEQIAKEVEKAFEAKWDAEGNFIIDTFIMTVAAMKQS